MNEIKAYAVILGPIILILLAICVGSCAMEARSFNKFSQKKADIWDAMFIELRVEACK